MTYTTQQIAKILKVQVTTVRRIKNDFGSKEFHMPEGLSFECALVVTAAITREQAQRLIKRQEHHLKALKGQIKYLKRNEQI